MLCWSGTDGSYGSGMGIGHAPPQFDHQVDAEDGVPGVHDAGTHREAALSMLLFVFAWSDDCTGSMGQRQKCRGTIHMPSLRGQITCFQIATFNFK